MIRLGQRFIYARKQKRINLEQAAKDLRIRVEFLDALEKGNYKKLPSSAYAVGFVGTYAHYLGLPKKETVAMFRREFDEKQIYSVLPEEFTKRKEFKIRGFHFQRTIGLLGIVFFAIGGYILFQYRFFFTNPYLEIDSPKDNSVFSTTQVSVSGKSDQNVTIFVNNEPISVEKDGTFIKSLDLFEGNTVITVTAENRFGKKTMVTRHVSVKTP